MASSSVDEFKEAKEFLLVVLSSLGIDYDEQEEGGHQID